MIRKWSVAAVVLTVSLFLFCLSSCDMPSEISGEHIPDLLELDQGKAFISISKNDDSGYNRWLPFYLILQSIETEEKIEQALNEGIDGITLFDHQGEVICESDSLIWSPLKIDETQCNLSLVIIPKIGKLAQYENYEVSKIRFYSNKTSWEKTFDLKQYTIQLFETVPQDQYYISLSTTDAKFYKENTVNLRYDISCDVESEGFTDISLEYQDGFASIEDITIRTAPKEDFFEDTGDMDEVDRDTKKFEARVQFEKMQEAITFRPAIKLHLSDEEVYLIPPVPAYITFPDE